MARTQNVTINSVLAGWSPSEYFSLGGQFLESIGVDPEMPKNDSVTKPSGLLRPTSMAKFTGTTITGVPMWLETNNKDTNTYLYDDTGKVYSIPSTLDSATALNGGTALTSSIGNGCAYYNNYLYLAKNTDVCRYGPLNGSPAFVENFWSSTLSLTNLSHTTYPSIRGVKIPNHPMYVYPKNNRLYFADVDANNVGILSMIKTKKVTVEGDTNDTVVPSAYKVLDMYYGWYPTCIDSVGNELAIGVIDGTNTTIKQGNAKVLFWSTLPSDTSYNREAILPDPLITAMRNVNGQLYVFSGSASGGMRISRYIGGESFEEIYYADDQYPPLNGAVDYLINRIVFGGSTTTPAVSASVFALGSKVRAMSMGVHNILKTSSTGTTPLVTALKYVSQGATSQPIVGWSDGSGKGVDKISTTYGTSIWRSAVIRVGSNFSVDKIRIPLAQALATNMTLTVKTYVDDSSSSSSVSTINTTNYTAGERFINIYPTVSGKNNFFIELTWSGTALLTVNLPINIQITSQEDRAN